MEEYYMLLIRTGRQQAGLRVTNITSGADCKFKIFRGEKRLSQPCAQTAQALKAAGFSSYLVTDFMPDDIVPNTEEELRRQEQDRENLMPDVAQTGKDSKGNPVGTLYDMTGAKSSFDEQGKPIGPAYTDKG